MNVWVGVQQLLLWGGGRDASTRTTMRWWWWCVDLVTAETFSSAESRQGRTRGTREYVLLRIAKATWNYLAALGSRRRDNYRSNWRLPEKGEEHYWNRFSLPFDAPETSERTFFVALPQDSRATWTVQWEKTAAAATDALDCRGSWGGLLLPIGSHGHQRSIIFSS